MRHRLLASLIVLTVAPLATAGETSASGHECRDRDQVAYVAPDPKRMAQITITSVARAVPEVVAVDGSQVRKSPQGTRWFVLKEPDFMRSGPWTSIVFIAGNPPTSPVLRVEVRDHASGGVHVKWVNDKLLALDSWWGRVLSTDLVLNVETGRWLYAEEADYSALLKSCEDKGQGE